MKRREMTRRRRGEDCDDDDDDDDDGMMTSMTMEKVGNDYSVSLKNTTVFFIIALMLLRNLNKKKFHSRIKHITSIKRISFKVKTFFQHF